MSRGSGWELDDARIYNGALTEAEIGEIIAPASVPEPSSLALIGIGLTALLRRMRRAHRAGRSSQRIRL